MEYCRSEKCLINARLLLCGLLSIFMPCALSAQALRLDFTPTIIPVLEHEGSKPLSGRVIHQTFLAPTDRVSHLGLLPLDDETGFTGGIRVAVYPADDEGNPQDAPLFSHLVENAEWREAIDGELLIPLLAPNLEPGSQYVLELKAELPPQTESFNRRFPPNEPLKTVDLIFDFGREDSPRVPGATAVINQVWRPGRPFGWDLVTRGRPRFTFDPIVKADGLMCDVALGKPGPKDARTFTVRVPNGKYRATFLLGDPLEYGGGIELGNITIRQKKDVLVDSLHLPKKTYVVREASMEAVDEHLAFTFESDGKHGGWGIMALRITSADKTPSVLSSFSLCGSTLRGSAFKNNDDMLRVDGKFLGYAQILAFRLYAFAATETPSLAGVPLFSGRALTGLQIVLDAEGRARFAYSGVGHLELQRPEERTSRYIADAVRIRNVDFDATPLKEHFYSPVRSFEKSELIYDLASMRPDLGPLALSYLGQNTAGTNHSVRVSVSADGQIFETISENQFGQVLVFQKRFLRFQFDPGQSRSNYASVSDFHVWSWRPVAIPGLKAALSNSNMPVRNRIDVAAGHRPALIRSPDEFSMLTPQPDPWAVQNVFPLGMAFSFDNLGAYAKNLGINEPAFQARFFDDLAAHNVNSLYIENCSGKFMKELLDLAEPRGIRLLPMLSEVMVRYHARHRGKGHFRFDQFRRNAALLAGQLRSRDGLLAYIVEEECAWPEEMRKYSDVLRRYDPSHPALNLLSPPGPRPSMP